VPGAEERGVPNTARVPSVRQTKSGIDNFNVKVLKDCFETIGDIINTSITSGVVPDQWMDGWVKLQATSARGPPFGPNVHPTNRKLSKK
jgi:hypothetical protein